jgi:threonylcarbamoyladenosine tRNA methylthiotransferase MtaB
MKTFAINTLGCKVNQYESQQIRELLERHGLKQAETTEKPELFIVNTCCVTHTASAKSRRQLRKAQKISPDAVIVACGCLATVNIGELHNLGKNVRIIRDRDNLGVTLVEIVNGKSISPELQHFRSCQHNLIKPENDYKVKYKNNLGNHLKFVPLTSFDGQTRAFLKIQDGCDGHCSYCIIPKTRPFVHSKPAESVIREAEALVASGHKEIVLTGVFLGAYGQQTVRRRNWDKGERDKLAELLDKMAGIAGLARIRLSSLEPADVTGRLLDTFCKHRNIMPHLHLSLQSGSDRILKKMRRQYSIEDFMRTIERIKRQIDRPAITGDVIVGFPGEMDADFEETVKIAEEVGFAKMHIFSFSARRGTAAAGLEGAVDKRVIKERTKVLQDLEAELGLGFRRQFIGENDTVLLENTDGKLCGRSERYFMIYLEKPGEKLDRGEIVRVKLVKNSENGVIGQELES